MRQKEKIRYDRFFFRNRWIGYSRRFGMRDGGSFILIGIHRWYCGPTEYKWGFCLFGFELDVWFKIEYVD